MNNRLAGAVYVEEDGGLVLEVEGEVYTKLPRTWAWKGKVIYLVGAVPWRAIIKELCQEGDTVYSAANAAKGIRSIRIRGAKHAGYTLISAIVWGYSGEDIAACQVHLDSMMDALDDEDMNWGKTASTVAGRITRDESGIPWSLSPFVRIAAHRALQPGPMTVHKAHSERAVAVDRTSAFLYSMDTPMPVPGSWQFGGNTRISKIMERDGFIEATVSVPEWMGANIAPLPVRTRGKVAWPIGVVRGTWSIATVRRALELGCTLIDVSWSVVCQTGHILGGVVERIDTIKSKPLKKLVYTRAYGMLAARGGWHGTVSERGDGTGCYVRAWRDGRIPWDSLKCRKGYRPDMAAFVADDNTRVMLNASSMFPDRSVVGAHIDCLFIETDASAESVVDTALEGSGVPWATKGEGELRQYAIGVRWHGDAGVAACGMESGMSKVELQYRVMQGERDRLTVAGDIIGGGADADVRRWFGNPWTDPDAISLPLQGYNYENVGLYRRYHPLEDSYNER